MPVTGLVGLVGSPVAGVSDEVRPLRRLVTVPTTSPVVPSVVDVPLVVDVDVPRSPVRRPVKLPRIPVELVAPPNKPVSTGLKTPPTSSNNVSTMVRTVDSKANRVGVSETTNVKTTPANVLVAAIGSNSVVNVVTLPSKSDELPIIGKPSSGKLVSDIVSNSNATLSIKREQLNCRRFEHE